MRGYLGGLSAAAKTLKNRSSSSPSCATPGMCLGLILGQKAPSFRFRWGLISRPRLQTCRFRALEAYGEIFNIPRLSINTDGTFQSLSVEATQAMLEGSTEVLRIRIAFWGISHHKYSGTT